jgi:excisionase family DNA binding protein
MENAVVTKEDEKVITFFKSLERMLEGVKCLVKNYKPSLNGERYLTDKEVSERLKVSRRTLQDYRTEGKISYCQLGGKILYREIEKMLEDNYFPALE